MFIYDKRYDESYEEYWQRKYEEKNNIVSKEVLEKFIELLENNPSADKLFLFTQAGGRISK